MELAQSRLAFPDRLVVAATLFCLASLLAFWLLLAPGFEAVLYDLGLAPDAFARAVLSGWTPAGAAVAAALALALALGSRQDPRRRRAFAVAALLVAGLGVGVCAWVSAAPVQYIANAMG